MNQNRPRLLAGFFFALAASLFAASALADGNSTSSIYINTNGSHSNAEVLVRPSDDGSTTVPVNAGNPMPITGTVTTSPATPSTFGPTSITSTQCSTATSLNSQSTFDYVVTGTWTGTLIAQKSVDGTTFKTMASTPQGGGLASTSVTANGTYSFNSEGATSARVCGLTVGSGTASVSGRGNTSAGSSVDLIGALAGTTSLPSAAVITVQGNASGVAIPTTAVSPSGTFTNKACSITSGSTSQTLMASNSTRKRIIIQNPASAASQGLGTAESLFINFTSAASATSGSFELVPGGSFDSGSGGVTTEAVTVVAASTGHTCVAKELN